MSQLDFFRLFYDLPQADFDLLMAKTKPKLAKRNELLVVPGQIQKELYLVRSGVQMSYFDAEDKLHVIAFTYAPNPCAIPESFSMQQPSKHYLTCLTDSEFDAISYENLQEVFSESIHVERLFRKMTEAILVGVINRHVELHSLSIEERFTSFCRRSPHLLQFVPHKHLASYLGINPTNFSKLFNSVKI